MFEFSKNTLYVGNNKKICFNHEITKVISCDDLVVVLLNIPDGTKFNENIFGVDSEGRIKWQIEKILPDSDDSPYVDIRKLSDGLYAFNWSGIKTKIKLETGKVVYKQVSK